MPLYEIATMSRAEQMKRVLYDAIALLRSSDTRDVERVIEMYINGIRGGEWTEGELDIIREAALLCINAQQLAEDTYERLPRFGGILHDMNCEGDIGQSTN